MINSFKKIFLYQFLLYITLHVYERLHLSSSIAHLNLLKNINHLIPQLNVE